MRYNNQITKKTAVDAWKRYFKKTRGVDSLIHFNTPKFKYPSQTDRGNFNTIKHIWKTGDRYYKLAAKYYSDPTLWWIIAFYNQKPTEHHVQLGDIIYIPVPLESIQYYIGY